MPTSKMPLRPSDLDYELAMLPGQEIDADALDLLDPVIDARDTARELLALIESAQNMIERGASAFQVRERLTVAIQDALDATTEHVARIAG
jgi:hypothetical protein